MGRSRRRRARPARPSRVDGGPAAIAGPAAEAQCPEECLRTVTDPEIGHVVVRAVRRRERESIMASVSPPDPRTAAHVVERAQAETRPPGGAAGLAIPVADAARAVLIIHAVVRAAVVHQDPPAETDLPGLIAWPPAAVQRIYDKVCEG